MFSEPIYDPAKSYQENFDDGPFGAFAALQRHEDAGEPLFSFLGYPVHLPFGVPAGPLLNANYVNAALAAGFDIPVYKTVRTRRYPCHAWPNVLAVKVQGNLEANLRLVASEEYAEPLSITNSFGVPSFDPDFWQPDIADAVAHAGPGQVVVASFQGTKPESGNVAEYIADFATCAKLLLATGVKAMEVNLSCPNEGTASLLCFDTDRSREVVTAIKNEIGDIPLLIKTAYFADEDKLRDLVEAVGSFVRGICTINTISAEIVDEQGHQALPGAGRLWSGVCGSSIRWAGLEMVGKLSRLRDDLGLSYAIVGVGGVRSAADYRAYRAAGADAVMAATAMMWNPMLAQEIKAELQGAQA